jgi:hypothetical protein
VVVTGRRIPGQRKPVGSVGIAGAVWAGMGLPSLPDASRARVIRKML